MASVQVELQTTSFPLWVSWLLMTFWGQIERSARPQRSHQQCRKYQKKSRNVVLHHCALSCHLHLDQPHPNLLEDESGCPWVTLQKLGQGHPHLIPFPQVGQQLLAVTLMTLKRQRKSRQHIQMTRVRLKQSVNGVLLLVVVALHCQYDLDVPQDLHNVLTVEVAEGNQKIITQMTSHLPRCDPLDATAPWVPAVPVWIH